MRNTRDPTGMPPAGDHRRVARMGKQIRLSVG